MRIEQNTHLIVAEGYRGFQVVPAAMYKIPTSGDFERMTVVKINQSGSFGDAYGRLGSMVGDSLRQRKKVTVVGSRLGQTDTGPLAVAQLIRHRGISVVTFDSRYPSGSSPEVDDPHIAEGLRLINAYYPLHAPEVQRRLTTYYSTDTLPEMRTLPGARAIPISSEYLLASARP